MSTRSFLALEPGASVREELAKAQQQVLASLHAHGLAEQVRPVGLDQLHLTLLFLGDVEETALESVEREMMQAAGAVGEAQLHVEGVGAFPRTDAPRVVWVGLKGEVGNLHELHSSLSPRLRSLCPQMDLKPLKPHLTVLRVRQGSGGRARKEPRWQQALESVKLAPIAWPVYTVSMISSELSPRGPIYRRLASAPLRSD